MSDKMQLAYQFYTNETESGCSVLGIDENGVVKKVFLKKTLPIPRDADSVRLSNELEKQASSYIKTKYPSISPVLEAGGVYYGSILLYDRPFDLKEVENV